ncbi:hypothetical protein LDJ79_23985 [Vibrio tritonius]|uniref:DNA repair protein n=1 Tax=Vibrio tritonius TaxID=1435069 RepID=A0ABS7YU16_9VIBR|nr:hypothetical protein [Vibrio tritonius]MCA2019180.1 hypothetical protein [Vibrio tritonius]
MILDWSSFGPAILGAISGGLITGWFSMKATSTSFENQQKQLDDSEKKLISGLLQALHDEIETVYERYQDIMGARLETLPDGEALTFYYPLVSDFFTVYNGNSFLIGRIPSNDLRKQIIKTYTLAKGIVDSFRLNNDLVGKFELANKIYEESQQEIHKQQAIAHYKSLIEYAKNLKTTHSELKREVSKLLRELRKNGVLDEKDS